MISARKFSLLVGGVAVAVLASIAIGQDDKSKGKGGEHQLPAGWTEADMKACMEAGTPGKMHEMLAEKVGVWTGTTQMWMGPDTEPMTSKCTATITKIMDGRFTQCEFKGEMPGMGPFTGMGICGYDNTQQKFVSNWIDNHGTGIMNATGEMSKDGKTLTMTYNYTCPVTKKPTTMREVQTTTGPNAMTMEMFGNDPKSGKEFKMMRIEYTRQKQQS